MEKSETRSEMNRKEQQSCEQETIMWHTAPERGRIKGRKEERSSEKSEANQ